MIYGFEQSFTPLTQSKNGAFHKKVKRKQHFKPKVIPKRANFCFESISKLLTTISKAFVSKFFIRKKEKTKINCFFKTTVRHDSCDRTMGHTRAVKRKIRFVSWFLVTFFMYFPKFYVNIASQSKNCYLLCIQWLDIHASRYQHVFMVFTVQYGVGIPLEHLLSK